MFVGCERDQATLKYWCVKSENEHYLQIIFLVFSLEWE